LLPLSLSKESGWVADSRIRIEQIVGISHAHVCPSVAGVFVDRLLEIPPALLRPSAVAFGADREIVASLNDSTRDQRLHAKLTRYLLRLDVTLLVMESRWARNHFDIREP
jgi:hypothetical protein